jgi:predicted ester cyclase
MASQNVENLHRAITEWNASNLDGYLKLYDDGIRLHGYGPAPMNKSEVRGFYSMIFAAFPGATLSMDEEVEQQNRLALRFTLSGVHKGTFMGVPPTGKPFAMPGQTVLHFRDGHVIERWSTADFLGLMIQLGAIPQPGN